MIGAAIESSLPTMWTWTIHRDWTVTHRTPTQAGEEMSGVQIPHTRPAVRLISSRPSGHDLAECGIDKPQFRSVQLDQILFRSAPAFLRATAHYFFVLIPDNLPTIKRTV